MMTPRKIRVLIVDDSAVVRQTLSEVLSSDPEIEVIATAGDPFVAAERISEQKPDVITLDIEMPRMDGLTFLQKIMSQHPIPVVICSSLADEGAQSTLQALEYGAVDIVTKPRLGSKQFLEDSRITLCQAVKAAAAARLRTPAAEQKVQPKLTADAILSPGTRAMAETTEKIVAIGASTGGTEALKVLARGAALRCSRHRHRAAHAGIVHARLCQPAGQPVHDHRQRSRDRTTPCCADAR